ncbi:MAG: histidine phosphatase family protein [Pseudonocardiales bacterium]|nr:histidine phosphatase family protein [Pseudonocardiales bacterium]MBV9163325.1 histidine phosphatase family protein [Pseudonocardiales bacterium]
MTHTLILLRHAKSARPQETADVDRPLAKRGHRDALAVGRWLRDQAPKINLVVCSPALRAVQTWDLAAAQLETIPRVRRNKWLYGASEQDLLMAIKKLPDQASTALLVGHNPGLENFLTLLTGVAEPLKTSAIAIMTTSGSWERSHPGSWSLEKLATPRG